MQVLVSKLKTPRRYHILHRERLISVFKDFSQKRLVAVTAGAGYGKTTLVMDTLKALEVVPVWYRLDEQDTDFSVFVSYLYSAVQQHFSDSAVITTDMVIPKTGLKKQSDTLLEWLAFLEKRITQEAVLVLDDYHLVQDSEQINAAIEFILARLPNHIHLVIIGRKNLSLRLSTLRVREQLIEISEKDLSFTVDEIRHFFARTLFLTDVQIKEILASTGGWIASLVLLRYAFKTHTPETITNNLVLFKQTPSYIFSYLKETIFDTQPDYIKTFMMKAALLSEIDTRRCSKIFDVDNADTILRQMIEDHLMIFPVDESGAIYYLHHLFKDFLIAQLHETFSKAEIRKLHCRIAHETEEDDIAQALNHFIGGHAFDDAIRLFETHEMKFLMEGKVNFLGRCIEKIPKSIVKENPRLLLAQAKLFTYFGNPKQARKLITRAHLLFKQRKSQKDMVKCLVELGSQYYFTGYVKEAKLLMEQVLDDVEKPSTTYFIAMTYLTFLASVLGEFETAENYYKIVREVIAGLPDFERKVSDALINTSYSYTLYIKGEFERSQKFNGQLLKSVMELNLEPCLPLVYYQASATSFYLGSFEKGLEFGEKGIEICEKISLSDSRKGWNYLACAQNCLGLGMYDRAIELIDCSIELYEDPGNRWGMANAWECLHQVYLAQGKIESAKQILNRAIDIIDGYGLLLTEGILENSCAGIFIREENFSKALECLKSARPKLDGAAFHLFNNHLKTSRSYFGTGNTDKAAGHLSKALSLSERNAYDRFVINEKEWLAPIFKEALFSDTALDSKPKAYLEKLFINDIASAPLRLKINLLGQFTSTVGNTDIPLSGWKSSKALMILKYLAANRKQGLISREVLIEMLWPDEDLKKTGSRFNMAMSVLRKTLEPDLSPKSSSAYIDRKKDMYRLSHESSISIDTEQFLNAVALAQKETSNSFKALDLYLKAESIYRGPFLEEDRYEDWCIEKREVFAGEYLKVLKAILNILKTQKDFENAIIYTQKILDTDPFDESAFKWLMIFNAESDNLSQTKKTFARYKKMAKQMDCPVSPEIIDLYDRLTRKNTSI